MKTIIQVFKTCEGISASSSTYQIRCGVGSYNSYFEEDMSIISEDNTKFHLEVNKNLSIENKYVVLFSSKF